MASLNHFQHKRFSLCFSLSLCNDILGYFGRWHLTSFSHQVRGFDLRVGASVHWELARWQETRARHDGVQRRQHLRRRLVPRPAAWQGQVHLEQAGRGQNGILRRAGTVFFVLDTVCVSYYRTTGWHYLLDTICLILSTKQHPKQERCWESYSYKLFFCFLTCYL